MPVGTSYAQQFVMPTVPRVINGKLIRRIILKARQRPKSYPTLVRRLEPKVLEWIKSATDWQDEDDRQSRVLIFETLLRNGAKFFIRFWSTPRMPLRCEIASGITDDVLRAALTNMADSWAKQHGMTVRGVAQNFHGDVAVESEFLKTCAAAFVVETFVESIDYKGHTPLIATLARADSTGWRVH